MTSSDFNPPSPEQPTVTAAGVGPRRQAGFAEDFRRFFLRGLAALLPTLVTLWLLVWVWNFLWESLGQYIILSFKQVWDKAGKGHPVVLDFLWDPNWAGTTRFLGVLASLVLVYIVGVLVGNFIGRSMWRLAEVGVMRIPLVRAIYPAVKQISDFLLAERSTQFQQSRVVAVQPHAKGIWSIGLVTGAGLKSLSDATGQDMVTVFVPSSPTAFSGYVLVVPRSEVIELPLKVEEAMRLLVSGGVLSGEDPRIKAGVPLLSTPLTGENPPLPA